MEQFIEAMNEWYGELVEEQRAASPEVASQIRYVLSHLADARRIVKRLVQEEDDRLDDELREDNWAAFVEHVNSKPNRRAVDEPAVAKVKWGGEGRHSDGVKKEPSVVDSFLSTFPEASPWERGEESATEQSEVHGDDAR